jgi:hypothetical protein
MMMPLSSEHQYRYYLNNAYQYRYHVLPAGVAIQSNQYVGLLRVEHA